MRATASHFALTARLASAIVAFAALATVAEPAARAGAEPLFAPHGGTGLTPLDVPPYGIAQGFDERGYAYLHAATTAFGATQHRFGWAAPGATEATWLDDLWLPGGEAARAAIAAMDAADHALWILAERWTTDPTAPGPDEPVLVLLRLRAGLSLETVASFTRGDLDIDALADFQPGPTGSTGFLAGLGQGPETTLAVSDSGRACFVGAPGVICAEPAPDPVVRVHVPTTALADGDLAWRWAYSEPLPGADTSTSIPALAAAPDGRLMLLVDNHAHGIRNLVAVSADGADVRFVDGPTLDGHGPLGFSTLTDVRQLEWASSLGGFVAWPVKDIDYLDVGYAVPGGDGSGQGLAATLGWRGRGLRLVDDATARTATVSLTDAIARRMDCSGPYQAYDIGICANGPGEASLARLGDGSLALLGVGMGGAYRVDADREALDLDGDGLLQREEAAHGTSDFERDTDGGVTSDFAEVALTGTNPTDASDDPSLLGGARRERVVYAASPEIERRDVPAPSVRSWGVDGPACDGFTCWAKDGRVLVEVDDVVRAGSFIDDDGVAFYGFAGSQVSVDGTFFVYVAPEGLVRVFFSDGHRELYIARGELEAEPGPAVSPGVSHFMDSIEYVAVDADHTWVLQPHAPARVALYEAGHPARRVLDVAASTCASGLGACDAGPIPTAGLYVGSAGGGPVHIGMPYGGVDDAVRVRGFEAERQRLEVEVGGPLDTWRIGLHASEPPIILARQSEIMGQLMGSILPTGHGDYLVFEETRGQDGALLGVVDALFGGRDTHILSEPSAYPVIGVWGDTLVQRLNDTSFVELVRYDEGLAPGDLVFLAPTGSQREWSVAPQMLFRVGPRGGIVPLWDEPATNLVRPTGLDVSASGWMCIADRGARRVHLMGPVATRGGVPGEPADPVLSGDVVDCAWDGGADGHEAPTLVTLHTDPPRIERRGGPATELARAAPEVTELAPLGDPPSLPRQLARSGDGHFEAVRDGDDALARAVTSDGQAVVLERPADAWTPDARLLVGGRELARIVPTPGWSYDIVDRGQGLLMVSGYRALDGTFGEQDETQWVMGYELATGSATSYAWWGRAHVMARVPGAAPGAFDAWTGAPIPTGPAVALPPAPDAPLAPTDGQRVPRDEGCTGGAPGLGLAAAALLALARRARATLGLTSRASSRRPSGRRCRCR